MCTHVNTCPQVCTIMHMCVHLCTLEHMCSPVCMGVYVCVCTTTTTAPDEHYGDNEQTLMTMKTLMTMLTMNALFLSAPLRVHSASWPVHSLSLIAHFNVAWTFRFLPGAAWASYLYCVSRASFTARSAANNASSRAPYEALLWLIAPLRGIVAYSP